MSSNVKHLPVRNKEKLTWGEFIKRAHDAGINEGDEIDSISVSWGSPDKIEIKKDEDFGWPHA